jgi:glycerol 2-dehydrogenase (NADP+)
MRNRSQVSKIASDTSMTSDQVILSWTVQRGTAVVPKTAQDQHLKENLTLARLSDQHFVAVDNLTEGRGNYVLSGPDGAYWV